MHLTQCFDHRVTAVIRPTVPSLAVTLSVEKSGSPTDKFTQERTRKKNGSRVDSSESLCYSPAQPEQEQAASSELRRIPVVVPQS